MSWDFSNQGGGMTEMNESKDEKKVPHDTVLVVQKGTIDPKSIFRRIDDYIENGGK
jgi:hypothetical protein